MTTENAVQMHAWAAENSALGNNWIQKRRAEIDALPKGTVVVINVATGEFVTGKSFPEANGIFDQRFGSATPGHVYRVGERSFIGGGIGKTYG
jgi:hypothetical protein